MRVRKVLKIVGIVLLSFIVIVAGVGVGLYLHDKWRTETQQEALAAFYTPPDPISGDPGTVIRSELAPQWDVPGGTASRILYVTQGTNGEPRVTGGMVWIPTTPSDNTERKVVAWAHGTTGLGDACSPSRSYSAGMVLMTAWMAQMMANDWVVTGTDYQGLGTPPPYTYLLGHNEANDVVNSVRAIRNIPEAPAGTEWAVYGHSQGGHAAAWTGDLAQTIAPELTLKAVATAAPAAELAVIMDQQWDKTVSWANGPEMVVSWPGVYPVDVAAVVSTEGQRVTQSLAEDCILNAGMLGKVHQKLGQRYLTMNLGDNAAWAQATAAETPAPFPASLPIFIAVGVEDNVVLAPTIAYMQQKWCAAGSDVTMDWLGNTKHMTVAEVAGPAAVDWIQDRFEGKPTQPNCNQQPPVAPYDPAVDTGETP